MDDPEVLLEMLLEDDIVLDSVDESVVDNVDAILVLIVLETVVVSV